MSEEVEDVRVALRKRFGDNEKEGQHRTVRSFFRHWLETRLAEQAGWMMNYINVEVIADAAVAIGRVVTAFTAHRMSCITARASAPATSASSAWS